MEWAAANQYVVFTHDLDFGTMLALSHEAGPSVLQVRAQNVLPDHLAAAVVAALGQHEEDWRLEPSSWSTKAGAGSGFCRYKGGAGCSLRLAAV